MILLQPFDVFTQQLRARLAGPLPGEAAQNRMTSRPSRQSTADYLRDRPDHRRSAVLMAVYPGKEGPTTALIVRPVYDGVHSAQLALPGGRYEEGDASLKQTALRETFEEIGVLVKEEQVLGALTPVYIPVSNYLVQPYVTVLPVRPQFTPDPGEVQEVLELPLSLLLRDEAKERRSIRISESVSILVPCYLVEGRVLWGATAMMMSEFEVLLKGMSSAG